MSVVTKVQVLDWLRATADVLAENSQYLTQLDAAIGDGDHGINMDRGMKKVMTQLPTVQDKDIGSILKATGMALVSSVGGAGGPLYGTLFMRAGTAVSGKEVLSAEDLAKLLQEGVNGVVERGRAQLGDKTMVDALSPAAEAFKKSVNDGQDLTEGLRMAVEAAEQGMKATIPLIARKGRASYLGERSKDHQDPGATSSYLILKTLLDTCLKTAS
jgi:dihydroxyacetone kinase-like protein